MTAWNDYRDMAKSRGALALELFVAISIPTGSIESVKAALPEHLAYQQTQEREGALVLAGPLSDLSGDKMEAAGMMIYRATSLEAAKAIAEADPMHSSGARGFTLRKWLVNEGSINLSVGLSTGTVTLG